MKQWRSREEKVNGPTTEREFQTHSPWLGQVGRRRFLKLLGGTMALAGITGCRAVPEAEIRPYVHQPPGQYPGVSKFYSSAVTVNGVARGVLVETVDGRPIKLEGHPTHPASLGATDAATQAQLLEFYSPDRAKTARVDGERSTFQSVLDILRLQGDGEGFRILTRTVTSPTELQQLEELQTRYPGLKWHRYEPGARIASREKVASFHLDRVDFLLSFGSCLFTAHPESLRLIREFARHRPGLVAVESFPTLLGSRTSQRIRLSPHAVLWYLETVAARLGVKGVQAYGELPNLPYVLRKLQEDRSLVVVGDYLPKRAHDLAEAINKKLSSPGVTYLDPVDPHPEDSVESLQQLCAALEKDEVDKLLILGGNPVYDAPGELDFGALLGRAEQTCHLSVRENETSSACRLFLPQAHFLASWGDPRDLQGRVVFQQPSIEPLYGGRTSTQVLGAMLGDERSDLGRLRDRYGGEGQWTEILGKGYLEETGAASEQVSTELSEAEEREGSTLFLLPDPLYGVGDLSDNSWLQEVPDSITKLVWDQAVWVAPATAVEQGLKDGQVVRFQSGGREFEAPVIAVPGMAEYTWVFHLGSREWSPYDLYPGFPAGVILDSVEATDAAVELVTTQTHHTMEGEEAPVRTEVPSKEEEPHTLFHFEGEAEEQWGMTIDLSACVGCNACVVACQAENNIPVVGKEEVARGREMHWLRVDRYFGGQENNPSLHFQPVPCMHCETAPCEPVCPVGATNHSHDGLNQMVYNRCIGTRYCSNACPYKVRRFNFFDYTSLDNEVAEMSRNPEVSVRSRGVMEKCTYCVQRISHARIKADTEDRPIRDGELQTACQQVCPAAAITFGNLNDPDSKVVQEKKSPRNYSLLSELNTRPRTTFLADVREPEPEWEEQE